MNKKLERMKAAAARESAAERFITLPNNSGQDPEPDKPKRGRPKRTEAPEYFRMNLSGRKDYITVMAEAKGQTITRYIQDLIDADREKNRETYEKLKRES